MRKVLLIIACLLLILPSLTIAAANNESEQAEDGRIREKEEVIYATLDQNGKSKELYIVNTLHISKPGTVVDYGNYSAVKNLTNLSELNQNEDGVEILAEEGTFFYQGNMDKASLPWNFAISYFLDGEKANPKELAGAKGHLEIKIQTEANEEAETVFYDNYLLQISLALDTDKAANIKSEKGMLANAGKDKQVTFTVMPGEKASLAVEADVTDFEYSGINIAAVPSDIRVDAPDTDELTEEMTSLSKAISEINDGVSELKSGTSALSDGMSSLKEGTSTYKSGIDELDAGSGELVSGSKSIDEALSTMNESLSAAGDIDLSELQLLAEGLSELRAGLEEIREGLLQLKTNHAAAYEALDQAIASIPAYEVTEAEIQALYMSGADTDTVSKLIDVYAGAQTAKGTYEQVKGAFAAVEGTLDIVAESLRTMTENIDIIVEELPSAIESFDPSSGLNDLQQGIAVLSENYKSFHSGLVEYTAGVDQLAGGFSELDAGIGDLNEGTKELDQGVESLYDGTSKLHDATSGLPEQMTAEIDKMISEYDKSDFDAVSFISDKNERVNSVQFIMKTESIEKEEVETAEEETEEEKGIWQRFLDLFS